ncbi:hypothetical protein L2E82_42593 [Cichorium intybus]|uniref:Uncharacterized protein n=1 Tax=Cichorium intybus TaxID=13427 RepID=A0ACB8ZMQ9_CICIN|nr:hypothetical protein L2E82_42593 [Cichorium intybus]
MESVLIRLHSRNEETSPSPIAYFDCYPPASYREETVVERRVCSWVSVTCEELFGTEFVAGEYDSPGDGVAGAGDLRQYLIEESHLNRTRASVPHVWEGRTVEGFYMSFVWA